MFIFKKLRYMRGEEVVAEVDVPPGPLHFTREVFLDGVWCSCEGRIMDDEPSVMIFDCLPFQV